MHHVPENQWYVIALTREITDGLLARTVCGHDIVCYRVPDGRVVALRDRCPHRRYPLSRGRLEGESLVCGYHGFSFDCEGRCISVPGQELVPPRSDVATYPIVEQGMWTWVWIGDRSPGAIRPPATPWIAGDPHWSAVTGMAPIDCRFELLVDNLLDLSHETYLHRANIGTPEVAATPVHTRIDRENSSVLLSRHMEGVECPPFYARTTGLASPIDRWQDIEYFAPSYYQLNVRIAPAGRPPDVSGADPDAFHLKILYGLTPSSADRTYDFWAVCRDFSLDDEEVSATLDAMQQKIVIEDVDALNILERRIAQDTDGTEAVAGIDRGALAARRMIAALTGAKGDAEFEIDAEGIVRARP